MNILQRLFLCCQIDTLSKIRYICLLTFSFIRGIGETVHEEEFIIHKRVIKSPHDINSYTSLTLKDDRIENFSQLFSASYEKNDVNTKVPQHVVEECNVVVDNEFSLLKNAYTCGQLALDFVKNVCIFSGIKMWSMQKGKCGYTFPNSENNLQM